MSSLSKRMLIKAGGNVVTYNRQLNGTERTFIDRNTIQDIAFESHNAITNLRKQVAIISSGAIPIGEAEFLKQLEREHRRGGSELHDYYDSMTTVERRMIASEMGQAKLLGIWDQSFENLSPRVLAGQKLITPLDFVKNDITRDRAISTINHTMNLWQVPIINEDDTQATEEIEGAAFEQIGDNDKMGSLIARAVLSRHDILVILSNIGGIYDRNPKNDGSATKIKTIKASELTDETIKEFDFSDEVETSNGGGSSKLEACRDAGCNVVVTDATFGNITRITQGDFSVGTHVLPE